VDTRLIAWPGNGFQTEAVHVLTLRPGEESTAYAYTLAEEAMLCVAGRGEVQLRGDWRAVAPGDIAYFPEGVAHAVRNPSTATDDLHLVTQITPPQFDLYERAGYYDRAQGTLNPTAIYRATLNAPRHEMPTGEMAFHGSDGDCRAENLAMGDVRRAGALFNVYLGTPFPGLGIPAQLVLWPGAGCRTAGFNFALAPAGAMDAMHVHPVADECLVVWEGTCEGYTAHGYTDTGTPDFWTGRQASFVALETYDVILAPCGVLHGHRSTDTPSVLGGFASPPQLDLLIGGEHYDDGVFTQATYTKLDPSSVPGLDALRSVAGEPHV
jgi:gentisate 1,2-dioxygenase